MSKIIKAIILGHVSPFMGFKVKEYLLFTYKSMKTSFKTWSVKYNKSLENGPNFFSNFESNLK